MTNLHNFRCLGGYVADYNGGKYVTNDIFYRSSAPGEENVDRLVGVYKIKMVIDLRTPKEVDKDAKDSRYSRHYPLVAVNDSHRSTTHHTKTANVAVDDDVDDVDDDSSCSDVTASTTGVGGIINEKERNNPLHHHHHLHLHKHHHHHHHHRFQHHENNNNNNNNNNQANHNHTHRHLTAENDEKVLNLGASLETTLSLGGNENENENDRNKDNSRPMTVNTEVVKVYRNYTSNDSSHTEESDDENESVGKQINNNNNNIVSNNNNNNNTSNLDEKDRCKVNIPILNNSVIIKGFVLKGSFVTKLNAFFKFVTEGKDSAKKYFLAEQLGSDGLVGVYKVFLDYAQDQILEILTICTNSNNHPILIHCTHGKDRTGIICALLLAAVGVSEEEIAYDYSMSENDLPPVGADGVVEGADKFVPASFLQSQKEFIIKTFKYLKEQYGSVLKYLDHIQFDEEKRKLLAESFLTKT